MPAALRPLIKSLSGELWPLLETEKDRDHWLSVALVDLPNLRADIDWSGTPLQFTWRLVVQLLTREGARGRGALLNFLDDIVDHKGAEWAARLAPMREAVVALGLGGVEAPPPAALQKLRDMVLGGNFSPELDLPADEMQAILRYSPRTLTEYRLGRIAEWSQPRHALDKRFVQLALLLDQGEDAQGIRWAEQEREFQDLGEALAAVPDPALVLLGAPGSGKSTLLRRFELDTARAVLAQSGDKAPSDAPLTLFLPLNGYRPRRPGDPLPLPRDWLAACWGARNPELPPLDTLLGAGRMTLLLDALNEIPHPGEEPVQLWKAFLAELNRNCPGNRVIFSCRSLDYSASLSSPPDLPVPQLRIKSLTDAQVQRFLTLYCSQHADTLWRNLAGTPQLELLRTPYYLKLLVELTTEGEIPEGRAALFAGFVRQALRREVERDNPLFRPGELLAQRDCQRLVQARRWQPPWALPTRGTLIGELSGLAYAMQERREDQEAAQLRIPYDEALDILDHARDEDILKAGEALGVLDEDMDADEVLYRHQLLQEFFAARRLAEAADPGLMQVAWEAGKTSPSLEEKLATIADSDPLPPLPGTGWEETAVLAAAMVASPDAFVAAFMEVKLPLAGRCAAQPDVAVSGALKLQLQRALIERTRNPNVDLRARIAAGLALGELGDPRFECRQGPHGEYLLLVGITWHEARAYCAWLSAQSGQPFRLPTEA